MTRYGIGRSRLARKHPDTLSVTALFPTLLIAGIPLLGLLGYFWQPLLLLSGGLLLAYLVVIIASSLVVAARHGWGYLHVLPAIYFAIHAGLGWGFLREMVSRAFKSD